MKSREAACSALVMVEKKGAWLDFAVNKQLKHHQMTDADRRLTYRMAYGVTTRRLTLDYILDRFCRRGIDSLPLIIKTILRLGLYQIMYMDRIPAYAAVNEAAALAQKRCGCTMSGLVNAVLRNAVRRREQLLSDLPRQDAERIAVEHSHPRWLVAKWLERWGSEFTEALCAANNRPAPLSIRINRNKITVKQYANMLKQADIAAQPSKWCQDMLVLGQNLPFSRLPGFERGLFIVQGEASTLPVSSLELTPGLDVLDMCSAPGGKATLIASRIAPGTVTAIDIHPHRVGLVRKNFRRLGLDNFSLITADARDGAAVAGRRFPRILLDAPCTGTGVLRNKPDIKWRASPGDVAALAALQTQLLETACDLLRPGGLLVYSTCSLLREENEAVVDAVCTRRKSMQQLAEEQYIPHVHMLDGFFVAKLQKVV